MRLPHFIRDLSLGIKLNAIMLLVLGAMLVLLYVVTNTGINQVISQAGRRSAEQQANIFLRGFDREQEGALQDVRFLARTPGLIGAVTENDASRTRTALLPVIAPLGFEDVVVTDAAGEQLATLGSLSGIVRQEQARRLIGLGQLGVEIAGVVEERDPILLAAVVPLKNAVGNVVGTLFVTRRLDARFLDALDFGRQDVHIALIRKGAVVAQDSAGDEEELHAIPLDTSLLGEALGGKVAVAQDPVSDGSRIPDFVAYAPITVGGSPWGAVQVSVEATELFTLQSTFNNSMMLGMIVAAVLAAIALALSVHALIANPVNKLRTATQSVASGDYSQRITMSRNDEIGQLARHFSAMAEAIEQRISEAQAARELAEHSDRVKSAFLASMSHELRTPLNAVINFTRFVAKGSMGPVNEEQRTTLNEVIDSAKHLLNLINDVLDMSKIEAGSLKLFVEPGVDLDAILKTVVSTAQSFLVEKPVELRTDLEADLPKIIGDRQRILQILLNIVSNACKFTEQGHITIRAHRADEEIVFAVEDTGPGILEEDQPLVFTAFKQTETGLRQGGGTGLGMPISKNLTEAHGGRLWLESKPGKGAVFYVALPIKAMSLEPSIAA